MHMVPIGAATLHVDMGEDGPEDPNGIDQLAPSHMLDHDENEMR